MRSRIIPIVLMGALLELVWIGTTRLGPLRENTTPFVGLMIIAFAFCLWSFFCLPLPNRFSALLVIAFGLAFRLTLLPSPPYQSEDVYRYIWDAKMSSAGISPYMFPPDAAEIAHLRDDTVYPMINSKPYITAYPPLSQALFQLCYAMFGSRITPMKAVFSFLEFGSLILVYLLLKMTGRPPEPIYLVAWNPFFIFEFSHSGHSDSAMMFCTYLSILLLLHRRHSWAFVSYAGALLSKLHPALWFPLFLRRAGWRSMLAGVAVGTAFFAYYFTPVSALGYVKGLRLYFRLFEFNASIHYLLRYIGHSVFDQNWDKVIGPYLAAILLIVSVSIACKFPLRDNLDLLHAGFWIMTADLCLATTVHPWYISWAALALPFFPYAFMLYWTGACFLSYVSYSYHPVFEPAWVLLVEYLPMYLLMSYEIYLGGPLCQPRRNELSLAP